MTINKFFLVILIMLFLVFVSIFSFAINNISYEDITDKSVIIIGDNFNYPPYSYYDEEGNIAGFSTALAKRIFEVMGYEVEIKLGERSEIRKDLENGNVDVISGMCKSDEKKKLYSFSNEILLEFGDVFSRENYSVSSVEDLRNKTIAVLKGDNIYEYLVDLDLNIKFIEVNNIDDTLKLVSNEICNYAVILKDSGDQVIKKNNIDNIFSNDLVLAPKEFCLAVKKGNESLLVIINDGMEILKSTGEYQKLYDKWVGVNELGDFERFILKYKYIIIFIVFIFIVLILLILILKYLVDKKTKELLLKNLELIENHKLLNESENRDIAILTAIPDMIFLLDKNGIFLDDMMINKKNCIIDGEYIGKHLNEILPKDIAINIINSVKKSIESDEMQIFNYNLKKNNKMYYYESRTVKVNEKEVVSLVRDISNQYKYQSEIEYISYHDYLTDLDNRRSFNEKINYFENSEILPISIIMSDINGLKLINDSFGHDKGDELLIKSKDILVKAVPADGFVFRIGGDEFVILLPNKNLKYANNLVNKMKKLCKEAEISFVELSISFGCSIKTNENQTLENLLVDADNHMYKNKIIEGQEMRNQMIKSIIEYIYKYDENEKERLERIAYYSVEFAKKLNFSEADIKDIKSLALLHDIGKVLMINKSLNKTDILIEKYEESSDHSTVGYRILNSSTIMSRIADYVLSHHERWDGNGYPKGIKNEKIPIQARIIAIVDYYESISRENFDLNKIVDKMMGKSGSYLDPNLLKIFIEEVLE